VESLLKEITLEGFKSFRDKTSLKFDGPMTAVVGPNGSGKSNVVDAIKWVLGDPSPRSIRASTGLEAIYRPPEENGGEPAGYASVILKVDNSDSDIEDEPATWEIERRYYRSSESVYSVNGKTARLKDVRSLMAKKGFGLGSLSVVGQGEIDGFLSLVPTDRRLVFEDLAGISDFKTNKRKILNQLGESARNHERLKDLLGELGVRVDALAEQAEAAKRHAELTSEKNDIDAQLAAQEYILAARNVDRQKKRLEELNEELEEARRKRDEIGRSLTDNKTGLESARKENASILAECEGGRRALEGARAEARRLTEANQHLSTLVGTLEGELSERELRVEKFTRRQEELREIAEHAGSNRAIADRNRLDLELYVSRRWGYLRACERDRERLAARVERLQGEGSFFARDAEFHTRRAESLQSEADEITARIDEIREEATQLEKTTDELEHEYRGLQQRKQELEASISGLKDSRKIHKSTLENRKELRASAIAEITSLESENRLLGELERSREGYHDAVKAILERREEFPGLVGTLGELIQTEPGYEAVVERALGDSIEYLIVDTLENALRIIHTARSEDLGIVTCIVSELVPDLPDSGSGDDIFSKCTIPGNLEPVMRMMLFGAKHSETLGGHVEIDFTRALIASDGSVFRPPAFVSGGSAVSSAKGILTRRARLEDIQSTIVSRRWKLGEVESRIYLLSRELSRFDEQIASVEEEYKVHLDQLQSNITNRQKGNETRKNLQAELDGQEKRQGEVKTECTGCLENARLAKLGTEAVRRARIDAEAALPVLERQIPGINAGVEDLRSRLQRAIVEEASYREESERAVVEVTRLDGEVAGEREELSRRKGRLEEVRSEIAGTSDELGAAIGMQRELEEKLPGLEEKESVASEKIEEIAQRVEDLEAELEESRDKVTGMEGAVHTQEIRIAEVRGSLAELDKGLDDYPEFAEKIRSGELSGKDIPSRKELSEKLQSVKFDLEELGSVNPLAIEEETQARDRMDELKRERDDLLQAEDDLREALEEVEAESKKAFVSTFNEAKDRFAEVFAALFPGGSGELKLTNSDDPLESGIEVRVKFPGKGELDLLQFSGGERALIAIAVLFAILKVKPSSFTLLDEVEAALDDVNTLKFLNYLGQEYQDRQFILITHNKITMERANRLYGVTMRQGGVSQVVSVDLKKLKEEEIEEVLGTA